MRAADLAAVSALADRIHIEHPEAPAIFAERFALYPAGCFSLVEGGTVLGYAIAHPGRLGAPPPLDTLLGTLPEDADCLYLHDVALAPEVARQGHGADLLAKLVECAIGARLPSLALVAVNGSASYWGGRGFQIYRDPALGVKLTSYGADAAYMMRRVPRIEKPDGL